jgi:hypothetical protein
MNSLLPLILLLILAILFAASNTKYETKMLVIAGLVLGFLLLCHVNMREKFSTYAPVLNSMGECGGIKLNDIDKVYPVGGNMANLKLHGQARPELPLLSEVTIFSPVGDGIRLTSDLASNKYPTVDGQQGKPKHLFMLAHNQSSPYCRSTFSTDRGQVCTTENQRRFINSRGGNRNGATIF